MLDAWCSASIRDHSTPLHRIIRCSSSSGRPFVRSNTGNLFDATARGKLSSSLHRIIANRADTVHRPAEHASTLAFANPEYQNNPIERSHSTKEEQSDA
jgi:hypothetical protein